MPADQVLYLQGDGDIDYSAGMMRNFTTAIFSGQGFQELSPGVGAIAKGHGVLTSNAMQVLPNTTPNNTVRVQPGIAAIRGTQDEEQGVYICPLNSTVTLPISSKDSELNRIDFVVAQVRDDEFDAFDEDDWVPMIVEGEPGEGDPDVPDDCLVLARINVIGGQGSTVISSGVIEDVRPQVRPIGGITPVNNRGDFPNPSDFDVIVELSTQRMLVYREGDWMWVSGDLNQPWQSYGTETTRWNNVDLGFGGTSYAMYAQYGQTIVGNAGFVLGWAGGLTGIMQLNIPVPADTEVVGMVGGRMYTGGSVGTFWSGVGHLINENLIGNFGTIGQLAWRPNIPAQWTGGRHMRCFFMYKAAD